jgi:hypothetical protein
VSSLASFNRKLVLFLATKPLTCAHINSIGLSSQCRTGVLYISCPCKLAKQDVCVNPVFIFHCTYPGCMPDMLMSLIKRSKLCKAHPSTIN